jgi:hypothetical protein
VKQLTLERDNFKFCSNFHYSTNSPDYKPPSTSKYQEINQEIETTKVVKEIKIMDDYMSTPVLSNDKSIIRRMNTEPTLQSKQQQITFNISEPNGIPLSDNINSQNSTPQSQSGLVSFIKNIFKK